jgi:hypothetical protein
VGPTGTKTAIVKTSQGYRELACIEAPEVLFFDVITVDLKEEKTTHKVDQLFVEVCEPGTIRVSSIVVDEPMPIGARMTDNQNVLITKGDPERHTMATVTLCGVRRAFAGRRFQERTREDYEANMRFWSEVGRVNMREGQ